MAELDSTQTDPWAKITTSVHTLHDGFVQTQKLTLCEEKCRLVQAYFQKSSEHAYRLRKEIRISGVVAGISLSGCAVATYFSKERPYVHKFSTVLLVVAIVSSFWFFKRYIDRHDLQVDFFDKIPRSAQKKREEIDQDLKSLADVIAQGCDPSISLAESSKQTCSLLSACIAKNSYHAAILVAMMYKNQDLLKEHAMESFVYIREGRTPKVSLLLEQFGAHPEAKDTHLLKAAASKLNAVAIRELLNYGMAKEGFDNAVKAAKTKRDIVPILDAYGANNYALHLKDLAQYLKSEGLTVSEKSIKKTLTLLKA